MKTSIQKMVSATVCDICRDEIEHVTNDARAETLYVGFVRNGTRYDFHTACLADYKFPDPHAVKAGP